MNDIELLKQNLTAEKVFYNFNWHELVPEDTSNDSELEITTPTYSGKSSSKKKKKSSTFHTRKTNSTPLTSPIASIVSEKKNSLKHSTSSFLEEKEMFRLCKSRYHDPLTTMSSSEKCKLFPKNCWTFSFLLHMFKCFNSGSACLSRETTNEYIQEIKNIDPDSIDIKPPVDILYNTNRIVLLVFISGIIENFKVCFDPTTRILTISGYKLPYQNFMEQSYICHEIKQGYFERTYLLKKSIMENDITHISEQGVIKIDIPFKQEECPEI